MNFQPYTNAPSAFGIGLKPLARQHPLHIDGEAQRYRDEKISYYRTCPQDVVMIEPDTIDAQNEVAKIITSATGSSTVSHAERDEFEHLGPLAVSALSVQDDLIIMRRSPEGWRLVAASLCFPSSWNLAEKFGHPLEAIHAPVPHLQGKTGDRIRRIFDMLRPDTPLWRENWSIEGDDDLRHERKLTSRSASYKADKLAGQVYIRCEYQTLHKLPISNDILFTVKILVRSVDALSSSTAGRAYLTSLQQHVRELSPEGLSYKGLSGNRDKLQNVIGAALAR